MDKNNSYKNENTGRYRDMPKRKSIRLKGYDYSRSGLYFITIATQNHTHLFGEIKNTKMNLNDAGKMVNRIWNEIPNDFTNTKLHEFAIMPNHIHGIVEILPARVRPVDTPRINPISRNTGKPVVTEKPDKSVVTNKPDKPVTTNNTKKPALPKIVQSFKRHTTIEYIKMVKQNILPIFKKKYGNTIIGIILCAMKMNFGVFHNIFAIIRSNGKMIN